MTPQEVLGKIFASGGSVNLREVHPQVVAHPSLTPMIREHKLALAEFLKERFRRHGAGVMAPAWTRPTPDASDCPICGRDSCEGSCRLRLVGCKKCGNTDPASLLVRIEAAPLCTTCLLGGE